eukprot:751065-Hanusia_phi.AAC.3
MPEITGACELAMCHLAPATSIVHVPSPTLQGSDTSQLGSAASTSSSCMASTRLLGDSLRSIESDLAP